jgi:hypothetical protein
MRCQGGLVREQRGRSRRFASTRLVHGAEVPHECGMLGGREALAQGRLE